MTYMTYSTFRGMIVASDTPAERLAAVEFSDQVITSENGWLGPHFSIPGASRYADSRSRTFSYADADVVEDLDFLADEGMANFIAKAPSYLRSLLDGDHTRDDEIRAALAAAPEYKPNHLEIVWDADMLIDFQIPDVLRGPWSGPLSFGRDLHLAVFVAYARQDITELLGS